MEQMPICTGREFGSYWRNLQWPISLVLISFIYTLRVCWTSLFSLKTQPIDIKGSSRNNAHSKQLKEIQTMLNQYLPFLFLRKDKLLIVWENSLIKSILNNNLRNSPLPHLQFIQPCCWVEGGLFSLALVDYKMMQTEISRG